MRCPEFIRETFAHARANPVWGVAYVAVLLLPWMLIFARAGIEICCAITGLLFLWHSARARQWVWLRDPFIIVCFIAWAWLSLVVTPLALTPEHSAKTAWLWIRLPLLFAALRYWVLAPQHARSSLAAWLAAMLVFVVGDTLWQFIHGVSLTGHARLDSGRLSGPFSGPKVGVFLSRFMLPTLALGAVAMLALRARGRGIAAALLLFAAVLVTIMLSGERAALLTTLLAAGLAAGLAMLRQKRLRVPIIMAAALLLVMLATLFETSAWVHARGMQAVDKMLHYPQSDYGQLFLAAYDVARTHLLHGVGLGNFRDVCPELNYQDTPFRGLHPHHAFMEWFAEAGLPGLLLLLAMVGILLREALQHFRAAKGEDFLVPALALGVLLQHFFPLMGMQSFFTNWSALLLWYTVGVTFAALPPRTQQG